MLSRHDECWRKRAEMLEARQIDPFPGTAGKYELDIRVVKSRVVRMEIRVKINEVVDREGAVISP